MTEFEQMAMQLQSVVPSVFPPGRMNLAAANLIVNISDMIRAMKSRNRRAAATAFQRSWMTLANAPDAPAGACPVSYMRDHVFPEVGMDWDNFAGILQRIHTFLLRRDACEEKAIPGATNQESGAPVCAQDVASSV